MSYELVDFLVRLVAVAWAVALVGALVLLWIKSLIE